MTKPVRTYLIAYAGPSKSGRFFHYRVDDTAPTQEQIESMEAQVTAANGFQVAITSISLIGNSEEGQPSTRAPFTVQLPTFDGYQENIVRELQAAFTQAIEAAGGQVNP